MVVLTAKEMQQDEWYEQRWLYINILKSLVWKLISLNDLLKLIV